MPLLHDHVRVRAILETDRAWAVYALGDLAPEHAAACAWHVTPDERALILVYRGFEPPVLFGLGRPDDLAPLLDEVAEPRLYLLVRPDALPLLQARGAVTHVQAMWRMVLAPTYGAALTYDVALTYDAAPPVQAEAAVLSAADLPALEALYADGAATGEAPDFFDRAQVARGVFYGVWEAGALTAAAGTHLVAPAFGVGAVGNVYVRRDRRGRGLGAAVAGAVTAALARQGLPTIALNVNQANAPALRLYERLGYERAGAFYEGVWERG